MAFTEQAAANHVPPGQDRVLTGWQIPAELAQGWRLAAVIFTPSTTFRASFAEPRISDGGLVLWFPAPTSPEHLRFYVLLGEHDGPGLTVDNVVDDVGRMVLKSGIRVWVVADVITMTEEHQQAVESIRAQLARQADTESIGWAWGEVEGIPNLLDLTSVLPR